MGVTLRQIAEYTGVSRQTASHVLNSPRGKDYGEQTRRRIIEAARQLGYRPSTAARAMRSGEHHAIGVLSPRHGARAISPHIEFGLLLALADRDLSLVKGLIPDECISDEGALPRLLREWLVDVLLINYAHDPPAGLFGLVARLNAPAVWVNVDREADAIRPDDMAAARKATELLLEAGHKRIAFLKKRPDALPHYSTGHRLQGYCDAMAEAGLAPQFLEWPYSSTRPDSREAIAWFDGLLSDEDRPTALVSYPGPETLQSAVFAALRRGMSVPGDLSLVTFSDTPADFMGLRLTTFRVPPREFGRAVLDMALEKRRHPSRALELRCVPFVCEDGDTVGPPANSK